jgi:hypothetical protein
MTAIWKAFRQVECLGLAYSVEKLRRRILQENAEPLKSLYFERAEGPTISNDILSQTIVVRQSARLCPVFSRNWICLRNLQYAGN